MKQAIISHKGIEYYHLKDLEPWSFLHLFDALSEAPTYSSWTYQIFLSDPANLCYGAVHNNKIVGCCLAFYDHFHEEFSIGAIVVQEKYQKRGIAGTLFDLVCRQILVEHSSAIMSLETEAHNEKAIKFYASRGFVTVSRKPMYYVNSSDAIIMKMKLTRDYE